MVEKKQSEKPEKSSAEIQQKLLAELIGLEDKKAELEKNINAKKRFRKAVWEALEEDDDVDEIIVEGVPEKLTEEIELDRIFDDIDVVVSAIQAHERRCLGEMKSLEEVSGMFMLNRDDGIAGENDSSVDDMVDNMFDGFDINTDAIPLLDIDDLLDDEINGCLDDVFEIKRGED